MNDGVPIANERIAESVRSRLGALPVPGILDAIEAAAAEDDQVFLVGGCVRDILLQRSITDIDLTVEGDALTFAGRLADELGTTHLAHDHVQTAVLHVPGVGGERIEIDVARARTERYPFPGAMPEVEPADLAADLRRRDFTINALASSLRHADLGATMALPESYEDIESRTVRVLYEDSFRDDPTRLLRAVRYAARLGYEIHPQTARLIAEAVDANALAKMDSPRVRDELLDLLAEPTVVAGLELAERFGLDRQLDLGLLNDAPTRAAISAIEDVDARLALLIRELASEQRLALLDRLQFTAERRDAIVDAAARGTQLGDELDRSPKLAPSALRAMLDKRPAPTLAIAASRGDRARELVETYVEQLADARLEITGKDLLDAGAAEGPSLGEALSETLALKLDGFISGRADELAAALRLLGLPSRSE